MMKNLEISLLLDFYGQMLTEKQRDVVELYYNEDLSLAEIAAHCGITRQGVRDSIKRAEAQLQDCEERLGLAERFGKIQNGLDRIVVLAQEIDRLGQRLAFSGQLSAHSNEIIQIARQLND